MRERSKINRNAPKPDPADPLSGDDRRELLKKVARFAAYTAPALTGLYAPAKAAFISKRL